MSAMGTRQGWRELRPMLMIVAGFMVILIFAVGVAYAVKSTNGPAGDVQASTVDFKIAMPTVLHAGKRTIGYTNNGTIGHELVLFKTDLPAGQLPTKPNGEVDEESAQLTNVGDSGAALSAGGTETFTTAALSPGHYVAVCNLPGHYKSGMKLDLTVR